MHAESHLNPSNPGCGCACLSHPLHWCACLPIPSRDLEDEDIEAGMPLDWFSATIRSKLQECTWNPGLYDSEAGLLQCHIPENTHYYLED